MSLPDGLIGYGPDANCTLDICPIEASVLNYQPSIPASIVFIVLFGLSMITHLIEGIVWRNTLGGFAIPIVLGCIDELIGYIGRIILHNNPFSFSGFLMQITIYVCLARTIAHLDTSIARFNPKILVWFFIPCDIISLVFQAAGGALSSTSSGSNDVGINLSLFGLAFQVFTLVLFTALFIDYLIRYYRQAARRKQAGTIKNIDGNADDSRRLHIFLGFLGFAILLILIRCCYRIDELSGGYSGPKMHNEGLFYALESSMIIVAVWALNVAQPGWGLGKTEAYQGEADAGGGVINTTDTDLASLTTGGKATPV